MSKSPRIAIIGGGPAGLRAAELAAGNGSDVTVYDAMRSVGRKFLVAGKGGLNLTHSEAFEDFLTRYTGPKLPASTWQDILRDFDATALRGWAAELGVETFVASSGRIYPKALKAAPLLRRWITRLKSSGVHFAMNHRWIGITPGSTHQLHFANSSSAGAEAVVFALGGGSWPQTGSTGTWIESFRKIGVACHPLQPANCGWEHAWPTEVLQAAEGEPIKNIRVRASGQEVRGELMLTRYGLEGGAIYQLGKTLREMPQPIIHIDFKPDSSHAQLVAKMESVKRDFLKEAKTRWRLSTAAHAILSQQPWHDCSSLAAAAKDCAIPLSGPRPIEEAISSAGGVCWSELDENLMLKRHPGIFVAGEMIDWEAPTGGYLMQACFATGTRVGRAAARWVSTK